LEPQSLARLGREGPFGLADVDAILQKTRDACFDSSNPNFALYSGIREPPMKWNCLLVVLLSLSFASDLLAQGFTTSNSGDRKHLDLAGKPCLETTGGVHPLASNPKIYNHIISVENRCIEQIKAQICYHGTDNCMDVEVPGHSRKEQVIGVYPAMQQFRYDVKEQFKQF
jgi:hypothetical protein